MAGTPGTFRFRDFELDVAAYALRLKGRPVRLERQPMDLLILLVQRSGQLVSRSEIVDLLWGKDVFVDVETGVHTAIRKIRQALRDPADAPAFIETVPGKGYRFIAAVEVVTKPAESGSVSDAIHQTAAPSAVAVLEAPPPVEKTAVRAESPIRLRVVPGLLAVGLLAAVGLLTWRGAPIGTPRVTLAVLPFENLSGDSEREYLAVGLAEETITSLGRIDPDHLSVVARTSTLAFKGTTKSAAAIGRELGADYLVESTIRGEQGRVRITAKLIRVGDQVQIWSESYDRESASLLGLQQELSAAIAEQIRLRVSPDRLDVLARRQTRNAEAYDHYLRARSFANHRTPATTRRAIEHYERATAIDPSYALAWSGLALAHAASPINSDSPPRNAWLRAREAAAQAVHADPDLAEAQFATGYVNWMFEWDWPSAEAAFRRASDLDPGFAQAHWGLGHILSQMGRHDEAQPEMRRGRELDPLYAMAFALSSQVAFQARDYAAALEHARQAIILNPEFWIGYMMQAQAYEQTGRTDLALEASETAARFSGQNSKPVSLRGYVLAKAGRRSEAREVLNSLETTSRLKYVPPYAMALVNAGLAQRDAVFAWLDRAYDARDVHLIYLTVDPKWDPFRADPRFESLLARCDFTRAIR